MTEKELHDLVELLHTSAYEFWNTEGIDGLTNEERNYLKELIYKYSKQYNKPNIKF